LARALLLWDGRGLAPKPLALLRARGLSALVLERAPGAERLDACPGAAAERALRLLARRLAAIGELRAPLRPALLALEPDPRGGARALLLDPAAWAPRRA
jgi:hypothetical protein